MNNEQLQPAMAIWIASKGQHRHYPGSDQSQAAFAIADAFLMEHHPDLKATCEFALEPYNLDCEPKIDCLAAK